MEPIGVAVIGVGLLGERHARVYTELLGARLTGVFDVTGERARRVASRFGVRAYDDLDELLMAPEVQALSVATPDHLHLDLVLACLQAGKHVLVEKPLATDLSDARRMVSAARAAGRILMVNYSQRFVPEFNWAKQTIASGGIGRPLIARSISSDTISVPTEMLSWAAATSPVFFMTSHHLDLVRWYFNDEPEEVFAYEVGGVLQGRGIPVHDGVEALVRFRQGAVASFHSSWIHPNTFPTVADVYLELVGSEGVLSLGRGRENELYTPQSGRLAKFGTVADIGGVLWGAFRLSLEHFLSRIARGEEPLTSAAATLPVTATQCAILHSLEVHAPVRVELSLEAGSAAE